MQPIESATPAELVARMPESARNDLAEWMDARQFPILANYMSVVLSHELRAADVLNPDLKVQITDDQPFNEYFLLRRWRLYLP